MNYFAILLVLPLLVSLGLWVHIIVIWRQRHRLFESGEYVPLKARIIAVDGDRKDYTFIYQGQQLEGRDWVTSSGVFVGEDYYIYYNPKTQKSFLGEYRKASKWGWAFYIVRACLPLLIYPLILLIKNYSSHLDGATWARYAFIALIAAAFLFAVIYNFPRARMRKNYAKSSWSMALDAVVVERQRVSATKDRLLYKSLDEAHPFEGAWVARRHPYECDVGDKILVYYNTKTNTFKPKIVIDELNYATMGVVIGVVGLGCVITAVFGSLPV